MLEGLTITGITLTPEACSDILETAVEAGHTYGFGYWADLISIKAPDDAQETGARFIVGHLKIKQAVRAMLRDPKACACRGLIPQLVQDNCLDGALAEAIIQVACFGEVIYG